jgi:high-affinity Fe2+/Pb2+ permease
LASRIAVMLFMGIVVRSSEWLNAYGAQHWDEFCTQNYFDSKGIFIGIFLSAPLLIDSFLMLIIFLREASKLLVQVKTMELKREKKKKSKAGKDRVSKKRD